MAAEEQIQQLPYERSLRVIGRHLDGEPSYHVNVMEVADGFSVLWYPARHRTHGRTAHFGWTRLQDLAVFNSAGRNVRHSRQRNCGTWQNFPGGHEDFFRALGHVLDCERSTALTIDEVPEGVAVSYMRPIQGNRMLFEKYHVVYDRNEVARLLVEARARRRVPATPISIR